jgi:hypothetical protein
MQRTPTADLLRGLRCALREVPHAPRRRDILEHTDHSKQAFKRRFGSLQKALEAAEVPTYNLGCVVPLEDLIYVFSGTLESARAATGIDTNDSPTGPRSPNDED